METQLTDWWRGAVIYQIYPRSFQDSNGDGIGDLPGILERLDYVASLGVAGVWISPFFTSPMKDFGYDVADYEGVDPIFGTLDDFDAIVTKAHSLGLKVIIDQVYSHTSDQHAWFAESRSSRDNPKADWYVWADPKPDGSPPNNWQSIFTGAAWTWDARREQYYLHNFLAEQPDLNMHNEAVQEALLDVTRFWLERGVDGFRLDAINHGMHDQKLRDNPAAEPPHRNTSRPHSMQNPVHSSDHPNMPAFLERVRTVCDEYRPTFTVAEIGSADPLPVQQAYTGGGNRLSSAYGFEFLGINEVCANSVKDIVERWPNDSNQGWPSWAFSNHDVPRVVSRWCSPRPEAHRAKLFCLLQMGLRGNPFVYQGEELGLPQVDIPFAQIQDPEAKRNWPQTKGRDGARTPMPWCVDAAAAGFSTAAPWLPVGDGHEPLAVSVQEGDKDSCLNFFRRAIAYRNASAALRTGDFTLLDSAGELLAFLRQEDGDARLCLVNLGADELSWKLPKNSSVGGDAALSLGDVTLDGTTARLGGFSGIIAKLESSG